jgi:adenosylcobinamide-phosphate synthase
LVIIGVTAAAFLLDLILGDPAYRFHPIRLIGNGLIAPLERSLRKWGQDGCAGGAVLAAGTLAVVVGIVWTADALLSMHPLLQWFFRLYILYSCIALKDLNVHVMRVQQALAGGDIETARGHLSWIVGRETSGLSEVQIAAACIETLAENVSDGVIAPLFYAAAGGAPAAIAYKAVNTLDSMVGYKTAAYRRIGRVSARLDDAANYIPARLSFLFILAAGRMFRKNGAAWRIAAANRRRHASPNAGYPEAAAAGVLNVRLGGPNEYHGETVEKPYVNETGNPPAQTDIEAARRIVFYAALIALVFFLSIRAGFILFFP